MRLDPQQIQFYNESYLNAHSLHFEFFKKHSSSEVIIQKLIDFQVAIPSWALGTGGTRFGRFSGGGEPRNLEEK